MRVGQIKEGKEWMHHIKSSDYEKKLAMSIRQKVRDQKHCEVSSLGKKENRVPYTDITKGRERVKFDGLI